MSTWMDGNTRCLTGTSQANPHIAGPHRCTFLVLTSLGVMALWLEKYPSLGADQAVQLLTSSARQNQAVLSALQGGTPNRILYSPPEISSYVGPLCLVTP
eukprot:TRINITY_DN24314_c0_g1_i1.p2 TRINITY_DN24314_c0_g1~~TRINITY_DN24314_c0_g1_i1.p2  ORF type:complete len:100 (-),score=4.12 TRINITY_DN24314_c0_g1_i1:109-408(-)